MYNGNRGTEKNLLVCVLTIICVFNPISHGGGGALKTAPPCEKLKYFFGLNRL